MRKQFRTATMSHDELRSALWSELDEEYPGQPGEYGSWCALMDVYDGFCIAKIAVNGVKALYKVPYTIGPDDSVELGEPVNLLEADAKVLEERVEFRASTVAFGADAQALLTEVTENNPLFSTIKNSPNTHLVVFDLTSVGRPSKHAGKLKYQLATKGLEAALPTLISKPIHITTDLDAHFEAGKAPKPIGTFLGGVGIPNDDGTMTLRAIGTLWKNDFPDEVEEIQKKQAQLGASYEIQYLAASADRIGANVIEIGHYEFSGGAILKKASAAHPETQLLVASADPDTTFDVMDEEEVSRLLAYLKGATSFSTADKLSYQQRENLSDSDFALIQTVDGKKVRRFPIQDEAHRKNAWARLSQAKGLSEAERSEVANKIISKAKAAGDDWAKGYTKSNGKWTQTKEGGASMKYPGIPAEQEATVDGIIAALRAEYTKQLDELKAQMAEDTDPQSKKNMAAKLTELAAKIAEQDKAIEAAKTKEVEAANKIVELTASVEGTKAELTVKATQLAEIETRPSTPRPWRASRRTTA